MPDKKISELELATSVTGDDVSILVRNGTDYQYAFSKLLTYLAGNITTGSALTFVSALPQDNTGKNQDVAVNIASGTFYQKRNGAWTVAYTIPANENPGGKVLYGATLPSANTGELNDTYINTTGGEFYQKQADGWKKVFSMLNGPPGGPGPKGDQGPAGANGKTVLHGTINPSNQSTGTDGDFYINTTNWTILGPKTAGDWGTAKTMTQDIEGLGNLADLLTQNKTDVVSAINEVFSEGGLQPGDIGRGLTFGSDEKLTLDLGSTTLVSPTISVEWTLRKNDGTTTYGSGTSSTKAPTVDKGVKAKMVAQYSFPSAGNGQAVPESASSSTFSTVLPAPGTPSSALTVENISANRTDTITIRKPKSGLLVSGSQVVFASGSDTASDSCSISFKGRGFMMYSDKEVLTAADIEPGYNSGSYQDSRSRTFTGVTPGVGNYVYYIYDSSFGRFTAVLYNDAEAYFGAFGFLANVTIVNNAGINQTVIIARSNAPNAFNNSKLAFS